MRSAPGLNRADRRRHYRAGAFGGAAARRRGPFGEPALASIGFHGLNFGGEARDVFFGQGFARGDVLPTDTFAARTRDTLATLPTQRTVLATWDDGSVKHAAVAVTVPALAEDAERACDLVVGLPFAAGAPIDLATALSGRTLSVTITPSSGSPITQDLYALIGSARRIEGPLATEGRIEWEVPSANLGGVTSLRLVVDVRAHANGDVWVYPWFRNDIALRAGGGKPVFAATMTMDGNTIIDFSQFTMQQYMAVAIGMFGTDTAGDLLPGAYAAGKPEKPFVRHDLEYLARAGFIPAVATDVTVSASWKTGTVDPILASATWFNPLDRRGINSDLGAAGAAEQIGWFTSFQSGWLVSDCTYFDAWRVARGWTESGTRMEGQFWAADGVDTPQWLNLDLAPRFTVHQTQSSTAGTSWATARGLPSGQQRTDQSYPIAADLGHQGGGWQWLVYVLEAEAAHADNHAALAAWKNMSTTQRAGGYAPAATPIDWDTAEYTGFEYTGAQGTYRTQGRGLGWALLTWVRAAFILPDAYPARSYWNNVARGHINWLQRAIDEYSALMHAAYGAENVTLKALPWDTTNQSFSGEREVNWGWQTDFIRWALAEAKQKRVGTEATVDAVQAWVSDFRVRGLLSPGTGWNRPNACMQMPMGDVHTSGLMYPDYETVQASVVNFAAYPGPEWQGLYASTGGGYMRNAYNVLLLLAQLYPQWGDVRDAIAYMAAEDGRTTANRPGITNAILGNVTPFYAFSKVGWSRDEGAPISVVSGQVFSMSAAAAAGDQVGCVETTGGVPRGAVRDGPAFAIVSGNDAGLFTISPGGVIRRSATGTAEAGTFNLGIVPRNDGGTYAAGTVTVSVAQPTEIDFTAAGTATFAAAATIEPFTIPVDFTAAGTATFAAAATVAAFAPTHVFGSISPDVPRMMVETGRRVVAGYAKAGIIKRLSDNATMNVGFVDGTLGALVDEAAITTFVGAGDAIWTQADDQAYGFHVTWSDANAPYAVRAGTIQKIGNLVAMDQPGVSNTINSFPINATDDLAFYGIVRRPSAPGANADIVSYGDSTQSFDPTGSRGWRFVSGTATFRIFYGTSNHGGAVSSNTNYVVSGFQQAGANESTAYMNGTIGGTGTSSGIPRVTGNMIWGSAGLNVRLAGFHVFIADDKTNRSAIESNIRTAGGW